MSGGRAPARAGSALLLVAAASGCAAPGVLPPPVASWGTMREALREGRSGPRVALAGLGGGGAVGVGALAGLAGEVTIVDGRVLVAEVDGGRCRVRAAGPDDAATLLVRADVADWTARPLPPCGSYAELDDAIAAELTACGVDRRAPTPVRVRGRARHVAYHVIAGACPIADPTGPAPWRWQGALDRVELVGIYVEGAAGRWTHHTHHSHLHVVAADRTGHLDEVALVDAVLLLPAR